MKLYLLQKQLSVTAYMPEIMWSVISSLIECVTCVVCVMLILGSLFHVTYCGKGEYVLTSDISEKIDLEDGNRIKQEGQRCPKRQVVQAAIRLATAVITFRNKERNVRLPS